MTFQITEKLCNDFVCHCAILLMKDENICCWETKKNRLTVGSPSALFPALFSLAAKIKCSIS